VVRGTTRGDRIEAVVSDVGGVLLDWDPRHLYRKIFTDEAAMEWFLGHVCRPEWHAPHDRGASTLDSRARRAARFDFFRLSSGVVVSGLEKVAEPERAIYEILLERLGLDPASTPLVDGNRGNLDPAAAPGMPTLLFESPARLQGSLADLGLLRGGARSDPEAE